ncbi:hypothetical protein BBJ29_007634 [Phytophthora kernoviae]|uniref:Uncharacterized protein n=1 Tax=Phytophthora kernoviae TaxID=325452 RepID=A0A3F2RLK9_9STRA|nr:hypothetical protein BBP00_00006248 [Phytophthora kernoviae]RLN62402.1 hypothetical protein BBJ29_007634 [Phytophthora kernoviae]
MQLFAPLVIACALFASGSVAKSDEESKTIDDLYAEAVAEGGKLVLYHGGDTPTQQDSLQEAFSQRFPEINFTVVVDYSKYHDVRIDNQLETDSLVPDVVALQTLQDFTRWGQEGKLLSYKPKDFSKIHNSLKDKNGAWMAYTIFTFGYVYNSSAINRTAAPTTPADLTEPQWSGKIASSYPHDDDAVLFLYTRYVEKYGWDWVSKMAQQNIDFNRGSNVAGGLVSSGEKLIGVGTGGGGGAIEFVGGNGTDYLSWGQRVGILKKAKHPAAAKLFMNWAVSKEAQTSVVFSSVRTDISTSTPWNIPEANMDAFPKFMADREKVEQWKQTFALYFGEVQGEPSPGFLGLHPGVSSKLPSTMKFFAPITAAFALFAANTLAVEEETKTLNELYEDAIAEGGKLVMYHGGDIATQQDSLKAAFEEAFPGMNMSMIVDYSKYHDVRIDNQLETDTLVPDITALQTVQNFPRWAKAGDLLEYKPANFSKIYESLRDENGAWFAYCVNSFSYIYDSSNLGGLDAPTSPADLVDPQWAGKIASSYPHDDDAVLFVYHLYAEQYGWDWVAAMANQSISFNRGSHVANNLVLAQDKVIGVGTYGGASPIVYVGGNGTEYLTWGQSLAILAKAKNPAAAKLFMNWILSSEVQSSIITDTVRTDIAPAGASHAWEVPEANLDAFPTFMADREKVEHWKQTFALYFGEVQGEPTPGYIGVHPGL